MVCLVKLEHSDVARHQATVFQRLHSFRKEGKYCDVVLKSDGGTEHQAHKAVLCAASEDFQNMLAGPFRERDQVQQAQPVEMAASDAVVFALLEYIYGDQPEVELEDSFELLRLADAYNFKELAAAIKASLRAALDSASVAAALKVLLQTQDLHELKPGCEAKVAANFEMCIELNDFLDLSAGQLGRILRRDDLKVSREEVVVEGLFNWFKKSTDGGACLGVLLQNVDFHSLSSGNLTRLGHLSASMGPIGHDLQREVEEALEELDEKHRVGLLRAFRPKRRCLEHWSPGLGASLQAPQKVLPRAFSMCCHDGAIYCATYDPGAPHGSSILRWKTGDTESQAVAGRDARMNGANDLGAKCVVSVSPEGDILVADRDNQRLLSFQNGFGKVVLSDVDGVLPLFCSPNGAIYVLTQDGTELEKLVGATLHPLISSDHLPADLQFGAVDLFVTRDEVVYLSDSRNDRILRIKPGEAEPTVLGEAPNNPNSGFCELYGLFVTEDEKIYVSDVGQGKVWAFHPGDAAWTEVLTCPGVLKPWDVIVEGGSLYVNMVDVEDVVDSDDEYLCQYVAVDPDVSGIYKYSLPPDLQLERYRSATLTCCQIPPAPSS